jgi:hypothetical protein
MAVRTKNDSQPVAVSKRVPTVTAGTWKAFQAELAEHNKVNKDDADFDFFLEDMVIEYTETLRTATAKAKKAMSDSQQESSQPNLRAVAQSA